MGMGLSRLNPEKGVRSQKPGEVSLMGQPSGTEDKESSMDKLRAEFTVGSRNLKLI